MTTVLPKILVVEDDAQIRRFLRVGFQSHDYGYDEAASVKEGLAKVVTSPPDLIILDLGLPDRDGLDFLKELRGWSDIPVIVLTARERERDKIRALDDGANDYLTKPFGIGELLARIRVAFRQVKVAGNEQTLFQNGSLQIDYEKRFVSVDNREVHLTRTEYKVLVFMAKNADKVVTQHQLLSEVWGSGYASDQSKNLRFHMHQLRHKLEKNPAQPQWLINEPGVGYRLKLE